MFLFNLKFSNSKLGISRKIYRYLLTSIFIDYLPKLKLDICELTDSVNRKNINLSHIQLLTMTSNLA